MTPSQPTAILLVSCPDQRGIVAALSAFITQHNGNIIALDQYVDTEESAFFARMEWELDGFAFPLEQFAARFEPVARPRRIEWRLHLSDRRLRMAVMVSRQAHCLYDILARWESGEWPIELSLVLSNHDDHRGLVERHGLPFHHIPVEAATKAEAEDRQIALLKQANVDFIVLARYMQILSPQLCDAYPGRIINIHHSFLPSFAGAKPYHQAYERGVKLIGATCHYVTSELDAGPIIEQDVIRIDHSDSPEDMVRYGKDIEKTVLARGLRYHLEDRVLVHGNKTVVFR